jgi:putative heme-binding domain-containing protein
MVTTRDGQKFSGVLRNEDNFSLQLQALDGGFHLFLKAELENLTHQPNSLMPSDYASTLSPEELNDLVSFMISAAHARKSDAPSNDRVEHDDEAE